MILESDRHEFQTLPLLSPNCVTIPFSASDISFIWSPKSVVYSSANPSVPMFNFSLFQLLCFSCLIFPLAYFFMFSSFFIFILLMSSLLFSFNTFISLFNIFLLYIFLFLFCRNLMSSTLFHCWPVFKNTVVLKCTDFLA